MNYIKFGKFLHNDEGFDVNNGELNFDVEMNSLSFDDHGGKHNKITGQTRSTFENLFENLIEGSNKIVFNEATSNISREVNENQQNQIKNKEIIVDEMKENSQEDQINYKNNQSQKQIEIQSIQQSESKQEDNSLTDTFENVKSYGTEKNQTKNLCKGMMKAFSRWVLHKKNRDYLEKYAKQKGLNFDDYMIKFAKKIRKQSNVSITNMKQILTNNDWALHTRILLNNFLRTRFINHIFNSKMQKISVHLKYIARWKQILTDPEDFQAIK